MRLLLCACIVLAGCTTSVEPSLVLHFTLFNESEEPRGADPGPHCGTARVEGDVLVVEREAFAEAHKGRQGLLAVLPRLGPGWTTFGSEGYPMGLPATVATGIEGDDQPLATVAWDGGPVVDGQSVTLPHTWSVEGDGWSAEARLEQGPGDVRTFRMRSCA